MESKNVIAALAALAQESRLAIFRLLVQAGPQGISVGRIGEQLARLDAATAPATLSFHLKELSHAGLIESRQEGRFIFYSANYMAMNALMAFLTENCCAGLSCCEPLPRVLKTKLSKSKPKSKSKVNLRRMQ